MKNRQSESEINEGIISDNEKSYIKDEENSKKSWPKLYTEFPLFQ